MMTETCSKTVLLSQFPHRHGEPSRIMGPNSQLSFDDTYLEEARAANHIFVIKLPNEKGLMDEVKLQRGAPLWSPKPEATETPGLPVLPGRLPLKRHMTTHCAWAVKEALRAGGLPIPENSFAGEGSTYFPDFLAKALIEQMSKHVFGSLWNITPRNTPFCSVPF